MDTTMFEEMVEASKQYRQGYLTVLEYRRRLIHPMVMEPVVLSQNSHPDFDKLARVLAPVLEYGL